MKNIVTVLAISISMTASLEEVTSSKVPAALL